MLICAYTHIIYTRTRVVFTTGHNGECVCVCVPLRRRLYMRVRLDSLTSRRQRTTTATHTKKNTFHRDVVAVLRTESGKL